MRREHMAYSETASRIMDVAERLARQGGYNAFSFREIANEIGIKSASVHYHFPTKDALGEALAERYTDRFIGALGQPDDAAAEDVLRRYITACGIVLKEDKLMCLCGMFGAEIEHLPVLVAGKTKGFFQQSLAWLTKAYMAKGETEEQAKNSAARMISTVEGAMILARALDDLTLFDAATADLV